MFVQENVFVNVVCDMATILTPPQCVQLMADIVMPLSQPNPEYS